jgi:ribosomal protein S18 acetylase RimI-like enzyme
VETDAAQVLIRPARIEDAPVIVEFNQALAIESENLLLDPVILEHGVLALLVDAAKGRYFIAEVRGEVVGQIMHTREWSDWRNGNLWWIQSVYVRPEFRSQGVFRRLFEHLRHAAQSDPSIVGLRLYVEDHNERAIAVYARLGLKPGGYSVMEHVWRNTPAPALQ